MKAHGNKTSSTATVNRYGPTKQYTKENTNTVKNTVMENSCGRTTVVMKATSSKTTSMDSENTYGTTAECTKDNGKTTKCKEKEFLCLKKIFLKQVVLITQK